MFTSSLLKTILQKKTLEGAFIQQIYDEIPFTFWFKTSAGGFYISAEKDFPFFSFFPPEVHLFHPKMASSFSQILRHHLLNSRIVSIEQPPGERMVTISLEQIVKEEGQQSHYRLVSELIPHKANLILVSQEGLILSALEAREEKNRHIQSGELYIPPSPSLTKSPEEAVSLPSPSIWEELRSHQQKKWVDFYLQQQIKEIEKEEKKIKKVLEKIQQDLEKTEDAHLWQRKGELLKSNYHLLQSGKKEVEVVDYFAEGSPKMIIPLDPRLSPSDNLEKIFKKYKKLSRGQEKIEERKKEMDALMERLEKQRKGWEEMPADEVVAKYISSLYPKEIKKSPLSAKKKKEEQKEAGLRHFLSQDGWKILVGKGDKENDHLSFRVAQGKDFFFHVQGFPGSHVVAINPVKQEYIPQETLLDSATLAVYYSKIRGTEKGEVTYTQCKNLKKPKKAPPGKVLLLHSKNILVKIEPSRLKRLLDGAGISGEKT